MRWKLAHRNDICLDNSVSSSVAQDYFLTLISSVEAFGLVDLASYYRPFAGWTTAHDLALRGPVPDYSDPGFWCLRDSFGFTPAHVAACVRRLPARFKFWDLKEDHAGWSVAHTAAKFNLLPKGFNKWDLSDKDGWTVAHALADFGVLPEDFNLWNLRAKSGVSVEDVYSSRTN